jgi:choline dehydrogenase
MVADLSGPPAEADTVVVGGGTAGCVVAARLAEAGVDVLVLEAGPDYGPRGDPRWPADLLDGTRLPGSHDWGYDSGDQYDEVVTFNRARVVGGCSDVNGTTQTWGHRADYDGWESAGNPGWGTDELLPLFEIATTQMRVTTYGAEQLTPWQEAWYEAGPAVGLPQLPTLNDVDERHGVAPESVNVVDGIRYNAAFAYLDPVRSLANLTVLGDALVDRVIVHAGRARGVVMHHRGDVVEVGAHRVVVAAGAYNSPTLLMRSGIGTPAELAALEIPVVCAVDGVGKNLHDQPFVLMSWAGTDRLHQRMDAARRLGWTPDEQVMAKASSPFERVGFDTHLLPYSPTHLGDGKRWSAGAAALLPRSRGTLTLTSRDPEAKPIIDHRFLTDPDDHDTAVLVHGVMLLRELASKPGIAELVGAEVTPGCDVRSRAEIAAWIHRHPDNYWHPVGTLKMGPASDPTAVVDHRGQVHGVEGLHVADCAIMPVIPRATTAMPAVVIGERIARFLAEGAGPPRRIAGNQRALR